MMVAAAEGDRLRLRYLATTSEAKERRGEGEGVKATIYISRTELVQIKSSSISSVFRYIIPYSQALFISRA